MDECGVSLNREHVWRIDEVERRGDVLVLKRMCCLCRKMDVTTEESPLPKAPPEVPGDETFLGIVYEIVDQAPLLLAAYSLIMLEWLFGDDDE